MGVTAEEWSYGTLVLVILLSTGSIVRLAKGSWRAKASNNGLYEDEDGAATEDSAIQFSSKRPFIFVWVAVAAGLAFSFSLAVVATIQRDESFAGPYLARLWQIFTAWVSK
jgi:hypothetical protein